jgi:thiol-disulfide isomerase/thioredoxin
MRLKFLASLVTLLFLTVTMVNAGGYLIRVKVNGLKDSTCYLGHYFGQHQYVKDTAKANANGEIVFDGKEALDGGIYFIVLPKKKFFEFIVDKEQNMSFETDTSDFAGHMKVKGSKENTMFYEYLNFVSNRQKLFTEYKNKGTKYTDNKDSVDYYKKKMDEIDKAVQDYKMDFIKQNPDFLISKVFKASKEPEIPETPLLPNGAKDSLFPYRYYKEHFWDYIDFNDDRLLRTPVFYNRLNYYMEKIVAQTPDSIEKEADMIIEKGRNNKEMFKYLVWYFTYTYETSSVMGFDAIFVYMVEKYYMTNQCYWVSPTTLDNLTKRAMKLKPILLGKIAPNLIMQDTSLNLQSLQAINATFTILLFWDPECGHCQNEVPKIHEFYLKSKAEIGFEVFAVCTDTNMAKMKSFIRKHKLSWINVDGPRAMTPNFAETYDVYSTPVIFILDDKKVIIAKRLAFDQIEDFLRHEMKRKAGEKP